MNEKLPEHDVSWITEDVYCRTDRMCTWELGTVTALDRVRRTATVCIYDPKDEETLLEFTDIPLEHLRPFDEQEEVRLAESGEPLTPDELQLSIARDFVFQGLAAMDPEHAVNCFVQALEHDPENWFAAGACADSYSELGNWQSAVAFYRRAVAVPEGHKWPSLYFALASCLGSLKKFDDEAAAYQACLDLDPDYPFARNNMGYALLRAGKPEAAIPVFEESIRKQNDGNYPKRNLPKALAQAGRVDEAISFLKGHKLSKEASKLLAELERRKAAKNDARAPPLAPDDEADGVAVPKKPKLAGSAAPAVFHKEKYLEEQLVESLRRGEKVFERDLVLYAPSDGRSGQQFAIAGAGVIDLLTIDQATGAWVVIELKRGPSDEAVVDQVHGYMRAVEKKVAKPGEKVLGLVCVGEAPESLRTRAKTIGVEVFTYSVAFQRV